MENISPALLEWFYKNRRSLWVLFIPVNLLPGIKNYFQYTTLCGHKKGGGHTRRTIWNARRVRFAHIQRNYYLKFRVWSDRVCGAQRSNESPSGAFKRQSGLR